MSDPKVIMFNIFTKELNLSSESALKLIKAIQDLQPSPIKKPTNKSTDIIKWIVICFAILALMIIGLYFKN